MSNGFGPAQPKPEPKTTIVKTMRMLYREQREKRDSYMEALHVLDNPYSSPVATAHAQEIIAQQMHEAYLRRAQINLKNWPKDRPIKVYDTYGKGYA